MIGQGQGVVAQAGEPEDDEDHEDVQRHHGQHAPDIAAEHGDDVGDDR